MNPRVNAADKDLFVDKFMLLHERRGIGERWADKVYNTEFSFTEFRNTYRVEVKGKSKRFTNLCYAAEFLFDNTFDPFFVHKEPKKNTSANKKLGKAKWTVKKYYFQQLITQLRRHLTALQAI